MHTFVVLFWLFANCLFCNYQFYWYEVKTYFLSLNIYMTIYLTQVYTVGPDYCHAEARKSPALDGKVERDKSGKEIRYPVLLSAKDKLLARKVCLAFKVSLTN
jgi:hypothetical protein